MNHFPAIHDMFSALSSAYKWFLLAYITDIMVQIKLFLRSCLISVYSVCIHDKSNLECIAFDLTRQALLDNIFRIIKYWQDKFSWVKVFMIIPEFRILRLTFHRKSASKC